MNINDLYKRLDKIFVEHTTHQWKNGWQHEGDRLSKELTIQKNVPWNNLFLLQQTHDYGSGSGLSLDGPHGFKIEVKPERIDMIRVDIEAKQMSDIDIYYYIDSEMDWLATSDYIVDLCQKVYDINVKLKEVISTIPGDVYGTKNPGFTKLFRRERQLNELGI
jgi:hypothetical protein